MKTKRGVVYSHVSLSSSFKQECPLIIWEVNLLTLAGICISSGAPLGSCTTCTGERTARLLFFKALDIKHEPSWQTHAQLLAGRAKPCQTYCRCFLHINVSSGLGEKVQINSNCPLLTLLLRQDINKDLKSVDSVTLHGLELLTQ